ncbi:O-antigen ligase family protein [Hymenobacter profundi]|uniref:O-antigen ligase family protein n=1 Tax=Hymenobacter profundi TaxID=1982110 RepID=A0ABS6X3P8_9BACT|nr:O-antigen ligase family protein [Hymenobacter profundi]MBW3129569.1 O-antigen ligase family protein [Hymenobacter profundi]
MKIKLNFLALLPILAILATSKAFWEFAFGADRVDQEPGELKFLVYALLAGSLASIWFYWRYFEPLMRKWLIAVLLVIGGMILESYAGWGSVLEYAHVFNKLFVLLMIFGIYGFYRRHGLPPMQQLSTVILLVSLGNLVLFHRESLSLSAFVENERGFNAASAYLFVLVILLSLNNYLLRNSLASLLVVFVCMPLVIFLQHRSVWIAMFIAIPIDVWLLRRARLARFSPVKMVMLLVIPFILGSLGITMLVLDNPQVVTRFEQSIDDIANADKQGTGSWRLKQIESYIPLVEERPIAGWRLEGFEVPMQFYDPSSDMPMWKDRTGHHFHNFYLDRAFYFGLVGVLLVVLVPIVLITRRLLRSRALDADTAALVAFFISLVVFGTSYDWSTYHYGLIGLMLAALAEPMPDDLAIQPRSAAQPRRAPAQALPI